MPVKRLIFLGPPGTGKGTQAERASQRFELTAMSSGDTLRSEIKADSEIGRKAAKYVQSGTLVPDDLVTDIMLTAIRRLPPQRGFILDGFPRTQPQAEALSARLTAAEMKLGAVVDFQMGDDLIVERIVTRRVCSNCGATYNTRFHPPRTAGVCDKCGGKLIQRVDDREDVVRTRLETYREQTAPLIEFYSRQGLLHTVDASREAAEVEAEVAGLIKALD